MDRVRMLRLLMLLAVHLYVVSLQAGGPAPAVTPAPAAPAVKAEDAKSCDSKINDVIIDCTEERARKACKDVEEDFEQCVANKAPRFRTKCAKDGVFAWCHRCKFKPAGCVKTKKLRKPRKKLHVYRIGNPKPKNPQVTAYEPQTLPMRKPASQ